jgi:hypothetical protein
MSNKQTAVQEAIDLIKQDYEANGRLRLAFVLQTLNKAEEVEAKKQQKYDEMLGMLEGIIAAKNFGLLHQADFTLIEQLIKEAKELC